MKRDIQYALEQSIPLDLTIQALQSGHRFPAHSRLKDAVIGESVIGFFYAGLLVGVADLAFMHTEKWAMTFVSGPLRAASVEQRTLAASSSPKGRGGNYWPNKNGRS